MAVPKSLAHRNDTISHSFDVAFPLIKESRIVEYSANDASSVIRRIRVVCAD